MSRSARNTSIAASSAKWRGSTKPGTCGAQHTRQGLPPTVCVASWRVETSAPNWRVETEFHYFRWDDFVAADARKSDWRRFPAGIATMMEFILTGTVYRYAVASWRYVLFFIYPLLAIAGIIGLAILA